MFPIIESINVKGKFKYLWLKYVTGVSLNFHCAKCLKGVYSTQISPDIKETKSIMLNEEISPYYYLCGVALPFKWENNFHLAFKYSTDNRIVINRNRVAITIINAVEIPILPIDMKNNKHPKRYDSHYFTCRNWQFANMILEEVNANYK